MDNIWYYSVIFLRGLPNVQLKSDLKAEEAVGVVVKSRVSFCQVGNIHQMERWSAALYTCSIVVVNDSRLVSIRPRCSAGQEDKREGERAAGWRQASTHTSLTGRMDRSQDEEIEEV